MTLEELIDMLEKNKKIHEDCVSAQREKLVILSSISRCIRTVINYLSSFPHSHYTEKAQLLNLYTEIDTQHEQMLANISKHESEIRKIELEIIKLRVNYEKR